MLGRRNLGLLVVELRARLRFRHGLQQQQQEQRRLRRQLQRHGQDVHRPDLRQAARQTPATPKANGTTPTVLAISKLYLGDTNKTGDTDPNAWKSLGYDLDGIVSTPHGTNHCKPVDGANPRTSRPTATTASTTPSARTCSRSSPAWRPTPAAR